MLSTFLGKNVDLISGLHCTCIRWSTCVRARHSFESKQSRVETWFVGVGLPVYSVKQNNNNRTITIAWNLKILTSSFSSPFFPLFSEKDKMIRRMQREREGERERGDHLWSHSRQIGSSKGSFQGSLPRASREPPLKRDGRSSIDGRGARSASVSHFLSKIPSRHLQRRVWSIRWARL